MPVTLRPAHLDDVIPVGYLHHRSRRDAYRGIVSDEALTAVSAESTAGWWVERWTYERHTHLLTVAEHDGHLVGFSYLGPHEDGDPHLGELYAIHVDPARLRTGIGRLLIHHARTALRDQGHDHAVLWVLTANTQARRFYERDGWSPDGPRRESWIGPAATEQLRYRRQLR
ncbi:GNAT family N-acetyltransferase [Solwaraspora sp. WMMD406]|uniref:GNAT family N-acetyltransferase n=1 Tax=Solwaraspora sp. WMMD406 TaxID=3016095 RepID=UPI0024172686|nr:GNAT family N-acetyltransferase [Solwaraspora sp. WMMD406]MDG4763846.1 GNAT family N-acetyltransferase [Solwaraspora sp. WMMD406]